MDRTQANAERMVTLFDQMRRVTIPVFKELGQLNLSFSHMHALRLLGVHGQMSMKELAEQLKITPPSVTALTRRLVQTGLVQRTSHPDDNRIALLSLTEQGRSFYCRLGQGHIQQMAQLLQGLSEQEQQQFLDLLERAVGAMRADAADADTTMLEEERPTGNQSSTEQRP